MKKIIVSILFLAFFIPAISHGDFSNLVNKKESFWSRIGNTIESILTFGRTKKKENFVPVNQQNDFSTFDNSQSSGLNTLPVNPLNTLSGLNTLPVSKTKPENLNLKPKAKEIKKEEIPIQKPIVNFNSPSTQTQNDVIEQIDPKLLEVAKQMLDQYDEGILTLRNTYKTKYDNASQGQKLCNSRYDIDVEKAKSDAEYLKTSYLESRSGFGTSTGALKEIEDALSYDLENYRLNKESCLIKYSLPNSLIPQKLNELSKEVSSFRSQINTPEDAVKNQNKLKLLSDEILAVTDLFRIY